MTGRTMRGVRGPHTGGSHLSIERMDSPGPPAGQVTVGRDARIGPVVVQDLTFRTDLTLECDDAGASYYYAHLPIAGRLQSRFRGTDLTVTPQRAGVLWPAGGSFFGQWAAGCRALCVKLPSASVDSAWAALLGDAPPARTALSPVMDVRQGYGRTLAELLLSLSRWSAAPDGLLSNPLVSAPLAESLINGFLLAATYPRSEALTTSVAAARPPAVRTAIDIVEADPRAPCTVSALATRCGVSVRTLQNGFRAHVGMSPMAYLREVRLRRAHEELRRADPFADTVAAIARRWGFTHLGRFAAAHEAKYGQTPRRTLYAAR